VIERLILLKAVSVRGFGFPHAAQVVQVTRKTRELGTRRWRVVVVYAVTSQAHAQASPVRLADLLRGHWVRDVTFADDHSQLRTGSGPQVMACLRNLAIGALSRGPTLHAPHSSRTPNHPQSTSRKPDRWIQAQTLSAQPRDPYAWPKVSRGEGAAP
jgi:hypothetical protein